MRWLRLLAYVKYIQAFAVAHVAYIKEETTKVRRSIRMFVSMWIRRFQMLKSFSRWIHHIEQQSESGHSTTVSLS